MSRVGERRRCATCNKLVKVIALIPNSNSWFTQQLECGHTGRIRIIDLEKTKDKSDITDYRGITD